MSSTNSQTNEVDSDTSARGKTKWILTQDALEKLLNSFSPDRDQAAADYELMRRKLVRFFEWRGIDAADDHTDETINRVARRIDEGQAIDNLKSYFYGVARMVYLEALRDREHAPIALDDAIQDLRKEITQEIEQDPRVVCLDRCLESLPPQNRYLIVNFYEEEKRAKIELRQDLADKFQISINALRIRAHRIRVNLEECITTCLQAPAGAK
ncbi:MAG TPA: sigma-70 family RNA polymerase sigma factor [Pyrinomonadaceae bacterium]|nr:sigma-70 family RNA polymerase sigma factor [Pyrinomonadaceae bacterium]